MSEDNRVGVMIRTTPPTCHLTKFVSERKSLFSLTKICPLRTKNSKKQL
jgi:hypothetical protein